MSVLFVEIGCEEIPARLQTKAIQDLKDGLCRRLEELGFTATLGHCGVSPRHMAVEITNLQTHLPDSQIERRGPRTDAPDKAIDGFCQSTGLLRKQLEVHKTDKGDFFFAQIQQTGAVLSDCLEQVLQTTLSEFPWPKSQRWADTSLTWVRPLHRLNVLLDAQPVSGQLDLGGGARLDFTAQTEGHPFYPSDTVRLSDFDSYLQDMMAVHVLVDHVERRARIAEQLNKAAAAKKLKPVSDNGLLDEITGLVEWPNAIIGRIDPDFMTLPPEVLVTSMRVHQKFFALFSSGDTNQLAPYFVTVANRVSDPSHDQLIAKGNERVLRARLSDAAFFWNQDKQVRLADRTKNLTAITFYEGLGSMADKAERMAALAEAMIRYLTPQSGSQKKIGADAGLVRRAALLAKADLLTGMVGEFPELQGVMGGYYAADNGEADEVVIAIKDHYRPQGPSDAIPSSLCGQIVSLADKIDNLVGFFGIGVKPTGSRDPFALRRAALGVLRILDEADLDLLVDVLLADSAALHGFADVDPDLPSFMLDRLRVKLREGGLAHDVIAAALAMAPSGTVGNLRIWIRLAKALNSFLRTPDGDKLVGGWRRVASLLAAEEKKGTQITSQCDEKMFIDKAETTLYEAMCALPQSSGQSEETLTGAMDALAALSDPINQFFENVVVNVDDPDIRANRLGLLAGVRERMLKVADFSQLEG